MRAGGGLSGVVGEIRFMNGIAAARDIDGIRPMSRVPVPALEIGPRPGAATYAAPPARRRRPPAITEATESLPCEPLPPPSPA